MIILALETSCDDTCAAVLENDRVLSNVVSSQVDLHAKWGGVVPDIAKRAHLERIDPVIETALKRAHKTMEEIEVIAVTQGPGLAIALGVGVNKAKELAKQNNKKLVAVNHIEGHILSNLVNNSQGVPGRVIPFPALALTVSGGHTKLIWIESIGNYTIIGETLDDAAGESLDKAAKLLGLGYPGGPIIERLAKKGKDDFLTLPLPMTHGDNLDFSFSGLKTSFYYQIKTWNVEKINSHLADLAASFQKAVIETLLWKLKKAIEKQQPLSLLLSGGVAANLALRHRVRRLAKQTGLPVYMPIKKILNTDNAAMIGLAGFYKARRGEFVMDIDGLDRQPRMELV